MHKKILAIWHQTDKPLPNGWYWRKCKVDDPDPECIEVCNGIMVDKRPRDSHGLEWEVYEHDQFTGFWWYGPLEVPAQQGGQPCPAQTAINK